MENFLVSARKYRPVEFDSVVGQSHITDTLEYAIKSNLIAQSLLFCGLRGVGKTTCARIFARKINEMYGVNSENSFSFNIFEIDAASNNSIDDIRNLIDQVRYPPQIGRYKVYIIDEVHMLSNQAFNAFLKTLEEPPKHVVFILATTEKYKIIPTILSRCQIFEFKRIQILDIKNYLEKIAKQENIKYDEDSLYLIAQKAEGGLRDALSIFDRISTFTHKNLTLDQVSEGLNVLDYDVFLNVTKFIFEQNIEKLLLIFNQVLYKGFDGHNFISELGNHFRNLMVAQNPKTVLLLEVGEKTKEKYLSQAKKFEFHFLINSIEICNQADINYKMSQNQRLTVEIALINLVSLMTLYQDDKKKK